MRSYLFVPADSDRKLEKAPGAEADCLLIDLEDSVSYRRKAAGREMAAAFIRSQAENGERARIIVRVNALDSGLTGDDLDAVIASRPDGILLPKSEGGAHVQELDAMIAVREAEAGIAEGSVRIHALVSETAAGVLSARSYIDMSPRLEALAWGGEDLSADLGVETNRDMEGRYTDMFRLARSLTVLGAAAAKVMAVDTVYTDFRDMDGLERECRAAVRDGFSGKMAIHPAQVPVINRVFTPDANAVERSRKIVTLFAEAGDDAGVLSLEGQMIDRPHLRQAERILARAEAAGMSTS
ncbi:HpcH/HpaI aldolase/citrate lyase family protein [Pararhizobium haloflavum]|uniref:HpcH/HpaI aldolase/citrate lyase family protein n=1 Tax=Pararhizobium haloflavum TaxID=2037914 RepID=UPI000C1896F2|nr:CoA ester lyase [Pararhizobium haloflavum]